MIINYKYYILPSGVARVGVTQGGNSWCHPSILQPRSSCPRVGWTRVSGRVTILPDFGRSGIVYRADRAGNVPIPRYFGQQEYPKVTLDRFLKNDHHPHHQLDVHFPPRLIKGTDGCFRNSIWDIDNPSLATFWDLSFSQVTLRRFHFEKIPFSHHKAAVYPRES